MRVNFNISAFGPGADQATVLKERIEAILREHGLEGTAKGMGVEQFATYYGSFTRALKTAETEVNEIETKE